MNLHDTETRRNLEEAFSREAMANRRYLFFAEQADIEGFPAVASALRELADAEAGHANGLLEFLVGESAETADNVTAALASEHEDATERYPTMAKAARAEGFGEIAEWFDSLAAAEAAQAARLQALLDTEL